MTAGALRPPSIIKNVIASLLLQVKQIPQLYSEIASDGKITALAMA